MTGPLERLRIVEVVSELTVRAGKLLGDLGADVIAVEPVGGSPLRHQPPFAGDTSDPELSLAWWSQNTNKRSITMDMDSATGQQAFSRLVAGADVVIEAEPHGRLAGLGIDFADHQGGHPSLIWVTVSSFDPEGPRGSDPATDLTLLASGGPLWACGYSDHSVPPMRGGGDQAYNVGAIYTAVAVLAALAARDQTGDGNRAVINVNAAVNVTVEQNTYMWLVAGLECSRQTGRHASVVSTQETQVRCADGRWVTTGVPPRKPEDFARLYQWLEDAGLLDAFPEAVFLEMGASREEAPAMALVGQDDEVTAIMAAARDGLALLAERLPAKEFFLEGQRRNFAVGIIYSPEEAFEDEHFVARGFQHEVDHPELGRTVRYPGAPYRFSATPWAIHRRPPLVGEHNEEIFLEIGLERNGPGLTAPQGEAL